MSPGWPDFCARIRRNVLRLSQHVLPGGAQQCGAGQCAYCCAGCEARQSLGDISWRRSIPDRSRPLRRARRAVPLAGVVTAMDYDSPNTMIAHWNLSVQRQIGADWLASVTYLGNETSHLWGTQAINPAVYIPGGACTLNGVTYNPCSSTANTNQRRRLILDSSIPKQTSQYYGPVNRIDTGGTANYNGLVLSVQRRAARGVQSAEITPGPIASATGGIPRRIRGMLRRCTRIRTTERSIAATAFLERPIATVFSISRPLRKRRGFQTASSAFWRRVGGFLRL